jgi:hypothetical protein
VSLEPVESQIDITNNRYEKRCMITTHHVGKPTLIFLRKGIRMSLSTVINPHIKKSEVRTTNAEVYFEDCSVIVYLPEKLFENHFIRLY